MVNISDLIASAKAKVGQVASKFDQDKSMPGFQLANGGLMSNLASANIVGFNNPYRATPQMNQTLTTLQSIPRFTALSNQVNKIQNPWTRGLASLPVGFAEGVVNALDRDKTTPGFQITKSPILFSRQSQEGGYKPSFAVRATAGTQNFLTNTLPKLPGIGGVVEAPIRTAEGIGKISRYMMDRPMQDAQAYNSSSQAQSLRTQAKYALKKGDINTSRKLSDQAYAVEQGSANRMMSQGQSALKTGLQTATGAARTALEAAGLKYLGGLTGKQLLAQGGIVAGIGAVASALAGQNPVSGGLNAVGELPKIAGLNSITSPVVEKVANVAGVKAGIKGRFLSKIAANGLSNVLEDELYNYLSGGEKRTTGDRLTSLALGAGFSSIEAAGEYGKLRKVYKTALQTGKAKTFYDNAPGMTLFKTKQLTGDPDTVMATRDFISQITPEKYRSLSPENKVTFREGVVGLLTKVANVSHDVVKKMSTYDIIEELQRQNKKQMALGFARIPGPSDSPNISVEPVGGSPLVAPREKLQTNNTIKEFEQIAKKYKSFEDFNNALGENFAKAVRGEKAEIDVDKFLGENGLDIQGTSLEDFDAVLKSFYNQAKSSGGLSDVKPLPTQELPTQLKPQEAMAPEVLPPVSQSLEKTPKTSQLETKPVVESKPLDNIISKETNQRGFLETVGESKKTTKGTRVKTRALPQEYDIVGNKGEIKKADKLISMDVDEAKRSLLSGENKGVNETVLGIRLAKHYEKTKQLDSAVDVIEYLDRQLRDSGRAIQAASLWNKMSPEAILRSANRVAEKLGIQLDDVTKQTIVKRMGDISKMPEGDAKQKATVELLNYIADKLPPSFGDNFEAYRYTNMLSSPKSHERNIYNNLFNTLVTRPVDLALQSVYDFAKHPNNPMARDVSLSDVPLYYKHVFTSFGNALSAAKEGMKNQPLTADIQGNAAIEQIRKGKVAKPLQVIPKFMQAQDSFFSTLIASGEKARLLKNGLSEAAANKGARELAESYLLRDKLGKNLDSGYVTRALDSLGKLALEGRKLPVIGRPWSWFVPFVTTAINAAKMMVEHSVLGLPGAKMTTENLAKATVGSMITAYGAMLAAQGKVTWEAPTDQKQKEIYYASGKKPFSVLIGDKWVPAWYFGPYALSLMMPAAVKQYNDESPTALTDDQLTKLGRAASSISKFIVSQTPLSGVGGFFSLLEGDSDYTISNLLGVTATQAIPLASMQRYINTIIDPIYRKGSNFDDQIKKSLLGQTEGLKPYLTPTGEESKRLGINSVLPYDIGQRNQKYEPYEKARIEKLQQNKKLNLAKKQAEEGKQISVVGDVYLNMDGSTVDVGKVVSMPSTTGYDKVKKQEATFKIINDVLALPIDQQQEALQKLGVSQEDAQYYQVAQSSVEAKTAYVLDGLNKMISGGATRDQALGALIKMRNEVNGAQIASDSVLKALYDQNIISKRDYDNLRNIKVSNGQITRKVTSRSKKAKLPTYNYKALMKPTKVAVRKAKRVQRIKL